MLDKIKANPEIFYLSCSVLLAFAVLFAQTLGITVLIILCLAVFLLKLCLCHNASSFFLYFFCYAQLCALGT